MSEEQQAEAPAESEVVTEGGDPLLADAAPSERPDWLPEKFATPEAMVESYSNLESKLGNNEESVKANLIEELEKEAYANRPNEVGDYVLPEVIDESQAAENPLLSWWANHAFENGFSQDEFAEGINMYAEAVGSDGPDYDTEVARLGDNSAARTEAVGLFAERFFSKAELPAIERMCETADGVMAIERIMESMKQSGPASTSQPVAQVNEAELKSMMLDPRWHDPSKRDPAFVKKVEDGFKTLYG